MEKVNRYMVPTESRSQVAGTVQDAIELTERVNTLFLNALPHPAMLVRSDCTIIVANKVAAEMGARVGELCWREFGKSLFLQEGNKKCWFCLDDETLTSQREVRCEAKAFGRTWDVWWIPVGRDTYMHYAFDITDRNRVEEALRRSQTSLAEAQRIAHLGNWEIDLDGEPIYCSDEVYNILGADSRRGPLSHQLFLRYVHPGDRQAVDSSLKALVNENVPLDIEYRILCRGTVRFAHSRAELIRAAAGKPERIVGTIQDITERKQVEIELTKINELKTDILANVSHELKSPLTSIKGVVTSLLQKDITLDEATRDALLSGVSEETDRLTRLVSKLLNMSKLEAGIWTPEKEVCQVADIIWDVKRQQKCAHKNRTFLVELPPDLPEIDADPVQIKQVLTNLIENALDYSEETFPIWIRAKVTDTGIEIAVSDRGVGIPREELERVFDKFFRGSQRRLGPGGTGLGLAICQSIINAHGGRIWAESEIGRGATFRFTLPVP